MPNTSFEDRLQRIGTKPAPEQQIAPDAGRPMRPRGQRQTNRRFATGGAVMIAGLMALRQANQHYDALRDSGFPGVLIGLGLGGVALFLFGLIMMVRAFYRLHIASSDGVQDEIEEASPRRQAPGWLRVLFTLVGLAFGTVACLYMFMFSAAWRIGTETAQTFAHGAVFIALCLVALPLLFGLVGIFLRGFALGRVPVYFMVGGVVTYLAVPMLGINMMEWQEFVALLQ